MLGSDHKEAQAIETKTLKVLKNKLPITSKVFEYIHVVYFHSIVNFAVILFLVLLAAIDHNLFNLISQFFILVMLAIYLNKGLRSMLQYWPILVIY